MLTPLVVVSVPGQAITTFQNHHANLFPNKQMLILKIREVRQRLMQNVAQVRCTYRHRRLGVVVAGDGWGLSRSVITTSRCISSEILC